jgi:exosortase H (IPTLxxWG-CTERM-specific)
MQLPAMLSRGPAGDDAGSARLCYHCELADTTTCEAMLRFSILFVVLLLGLFTLEVLQPVQQYVILPFTAGIAKVSVFLIELFDSGVSSAGKVITDIESGFAVSIEPGCNGVEALIILFAAIFAFPASLKHKLIGFAIGFVAIQALNLVRIISLFYLGQWNMTWFEWFHLYLWQALIILDALVVWLIWLRKLPPTAGGGDDGGQPPTAPAPS